MPVPKEVLEDIAQDIKEATSSLAELEEVVKDMRLAGMDTTKIDGELESLRDEIRKLRVFYDRQKAKSS